MLNRWESFHKICWIASILLILVLFWDLKILHFPVSWHYVLVKGLTILIFLSLGFYSFLRRETDYLQSILVLTFFAYSCYSMALIDMSYYYSFIEGFIFFGLVLNIPQKRFLLLSLYGYLLFLVALHYSAEPVYMLPGYSYKPHVWIATSIFVVFTVIFHRHITMYREELLKFNEKFALIGKQSSFLMHEIKSPLHRMVQRVEEMNSDHLVEEIKDDSLRMSSILLGIETLISRPDKFQDTFESFEWSDLEKFIHRDFSLLLESADIQLAITGFAGVVRGNRYLLFQVIKNLLTNAVEAIQLSKSSGAEILLTLKKEKEGFRFTCCNSHSQIPKNHLKQIFEPLFSTKHNLKNKGLGLTFSKNIIEGHSGELKVVSENNQTSFSFFIPETA